jgi:hypothetical protein
MEKVKCPNMCNNGLVKHHDSTRALFSLVTCTCCRGKGVVNENDFEMLNSKL